MLVGYKIKNNSNSNYKYCVESFSFYVCSNSQHLSFLDLEDGSRLKDGDSCDYGFIVNKEAAGTKVVVKNQTNGNIVEVNNRTSFDNKGDYVITSSTPLGQETTTTIKVRKGLISQSVIPALSIANGSSNYSLSNITSAISSGYTFNSYSEVSVSVDSENRVVKKNNDEYTSIGVTGSVVYFTLNLNKINIRNNWEVVSDDYGQYETELIDGKNIGKIESGCLIVKKSNDGINWTSWDSNLYGDGFYTTDYEKQFGGTGRRIIFTPNGSDIISGTYYQVLYAFRVHNTSLDSYNRVVEIHNFYLCSDSVESIIFKNLTSSSSAAEEMSSENNTTVETEFYSEFKSLTDGSETATGFKIDKSLNPNVTVVVKKNGSNYTLSSTGSISENGRYDIILTSKLGTERRLTIFVNKMSKDELYELYFSSNFLEGKRIYDKNYYPIYEGGKTTYKINGVDENHQYLWGEIRNITTGSSTDLMSRNDDISEVLTIPGEYLVILNTNQTYMTTEKSGDNHVIKFHFNIIPEGTAPGPQVNEKLLKEFNEKRYPSNIRPVYYGLTYTSATSGNITLAFADRETAINYAYNYEKGLVEKQETELTDLVESDGQYYRYHGNFKISGQKVTYNSLWTLTDALYCFAELAVEELYIDLSDPFTYRTLPDDVINNTTNLRTLELDKSVIVMSEGEFEKLLVKTELPIINSRKERVYTPGGEDETKVYPFMFVRDKYGYDSYNLSIRDSEGNNYAINYEESVEDQLKTLNFKTGIIEITEFTIYNDMNTYFAIYISENDNTQESTIEFYNDDDEMLSRTFTKEDNGAEIEVSKFKFTQIIDNYDPYGFVIVTYNGNIKSFAINDLYKNEFMDEGTYNIRFINRFGYDYSIKITIKLKKYISIILIDEYSNTRIETEPCYIEDRIPLISPAKRTGYDFRGYSDNLGNIYLNNVKASEVSDGAELRAVWVLKQIKVTLKIGDVVYKDIVVSYGDEIDLNDYIPKEYNNFDGWLLNDEEVTKLVVDDESNIILNAKTHDVEKNDVVEKDQKSNAPLIIGVIIAVAVILTIGVFVIIIVKKRFN